MVFLGRRGRAPGLGAGSEEGIGVQEPAVERSVGLVSAPLSRLGRNESHPNIHVFWRPGNGSVILLPMGKGHRQGRSGAMRLLCLMPSPPVLSGWGVGAGADMYGEGAICYNNWCWAAFTQQPACLGKQYLKNTVLKFGLARDMGDFEGSSASGIYPFTDLLGILAFFLTLELVLFPWRKFFCLSNLSASCFLLF